MLPYVPAKQVPRHKWCGANTPPGGSKSCLVSSWLQLLLLQPMHIMHKRMTTIQMRLSLMPIYSGFGQRSSDTGLLGMPEGGCMPSCTGLKGLYVGIDG